MLCTLCVWMTLPFSLPPEQATYLFPVASAARGSVQGRSIMIVDLQAQSILPIPQTLLPPMKHGHQGSYDMEPAAVVTIMSSPSPHCG